MLKLEKSISFQPNKKLGKNNSRNFLKENIFDFGNFRKFELNKFYK